MDSSRGVPTAPSARQAFNCATAGEEAIGKFTAARAPEASAAATKARASSVLTESGFSRKAALPAAKAAFAWARWKAGGEAT